VADLKYPIFGNTPNKKTWNLPFDRSTIALAQHKATTNTTATCSYMSFLVGGFNHLEKYEFVNGKDYSIPYIFWKIKFMFETTNQYKLSPSALVPAFRELSIRLRGLIHHVLRTWDLFQCPAFKPWGNIWVNHG